MARLRVPKTEPGSIGLWRLDGGYLLGGLFRGALPAELVELPLVFGLKFCGFARVHVFGEADALPPQCVQRAARDLLVQPEVRAELPPLHLKRDLSFRHVGFSSILANKKTAVSYDCSCGR